MLVHWRMNQLTIKPSASTGTKGMTFFPLMFFTTPQRALNFHSLIYIITYLFWIITKAMEFELSLMTNTTHKTLLSVPFATPVLVSYIISIQLEFLNGTYTYIIGIHLWEYMKWWFIMNLGRSFWIFSTMNHNSIAICHKQLELVNVKLLKDVHHFLHSSLSVKAIYRQKCRSSEQKHIGTFSSCSVRDSSYLSIGLPTTQGNTEVGKFSPAKPHLTYCIQ